MRIKITLLFTGLVLFGCLDNSFAASRRVAGMLTYSRGVVEAKKSGSEKWLMVKTGSLLFEGDTVRAGKNSQAAVTFTSGTRIKVNQNTEFEIETQQQIEKVASRIKMSVGQLWAQVRARSKFEVKTPVAVAAVRGTEFSADLNRRQLLLTVMSGIVEVSNDLGKVNVSPGQKTTVVAGKAPAEPTSAGYEEIPTWQEKITVPKHLRIEVNTPEGDTSILFNLEKK